MHIQIDPAVAIIGLLVIGVVVVVALNQPEQQPAPPPPPAKSNLKDYVSMAGTIFKAVTDLSAMRHGLVV